MTDFETQARALGWMTEEERHGVNDHHGVVHPDGYWAPNWQAACTYKEERQRIDAEHLARWHNLLRPVVR